MKVKELLLKNNIEFKEKGKDLVIRCLSPEHEDRNPSLHINPLLGIGHCFSCNYKVDIYKYFGILKDINSIKVQELKDKIFSLYRPEIQSFPRGYSLVMKKYRGISVQTYNEFKVFTCELEGWQGRVWVPIYDIFNNLIVFQGRYIASELKPKYLFYPRNIQSPLFPAKPDCSSGTLLIVEGIFDLLKLWDNGVRNVVCTFGLSVSAKYNTLLDSYKIMGFNTLIPLFDNDTAGNKAIKEFEKIYKDNFLIKKYELPEGKDPFDLDSKEILNLKEFIK